MTNSSGATARLGVVAGFVLLSATGCALGSTSTPASTSPPGSVAAVSSAATTPTTSATAATTTSTNSTTPIAPGGGAAATAAALDSLTVLATRPNVQGYVRSCSPGDGCVFGAAWTDVDRNGCDQRNDVLRAQLTDVTFKANTNGCVVATGTLADPYTGTTIAFVRGPKSADVEIDHVVPEALAWDLGAAGWTLAQRTVFANTTGPELLAVSGPANQAKGDSGPAEWLPPNAADHCAYVERFVTVLATYRLDVTAADKAAISHVLTTCP